MAASGVLKEFRILRCGTPFRALLTGFDSLSPITRTQRCMHENSGDDQFTLRSIAQYQIEKSNPKLHVDSVYVTRRGGKETAIDDKTPQPRYLWKEFAEKGFPSSPAEASTDLYTFLEQRDVHKRLSKIDIPEFCPGSIVAVTRADPYASKGTARFVGICISKKPWDNRIGSSFRLRNIIDGEAMEMVFMTHSPLIQKIEVLRHETHDRFNYKRLRDYPPQDSYVPENMEAEEYTSEPRMHVVKPGHNYRISAWFKSLFKSKSRQG